MRAGVRVRRGSVPDPAVVEDARARSYRKGSGLGGIESDRRCIFGVVLVVRAPLAVVGPDLVVLVSPGQRQGVERAFLVDAERVARLAAGAFPAAITASFLW